MYRQLMEKFRESKEARFNRAMERKAFRDTLSPDAQLARLDARLGNGVGAVKERKRLAEHLARLASQPKTESVKPPKTKQSKK